MLTKTRAKLDSVYISGVHAFYWSSFTVQSTFLVTYLSLNGYSPSEIGLVVTMMSLFNLIAQPMWGFLSDSKFNLKSIILLCMAATIPISFLLPAVIRTYSLVVLANALFAFFEYPLVGLLDSVTNISASKNKYIIYGVSRGMGSFFSAIICLWTGGALDKLGIEYMFVIHALLLGIGILCMALFSGKAYNTDSKKAAVSPARTTLTLAKTIQILLRNKKFLFIVISSILLNIGIKAALTYTPILIQQYGGTSAHNGFSMAINTIGMAPCMLIYTAAAKKISNNKLYLLACLFTIARISSLALVTTLGGVIAVQIINSLSYGFLQPAMLTAISEATPLFLRSTSITLATAVFTAVSSIFGSYIAGMLVESIGMRPMFFIFTGLAALGALAFLPAARLPAFEEAKTAL